MNYDPRWRSTYPELVNDWRRFVLAMTIKDKRGRYRKLRSLWPQQEEIADAVMSGDDATILKARQQGVTTLVLRLLAWEWLTATQPLELAVVSYKQPSAEHLLRNHVRVVWESLPATIRPPLAVDNVGRLVIRDSGAAFMALSAETKGGIRSYTFQRCLLTEFDHASDPADMLSAVEAALNHNPLIVETTAATYGSAMHQRVQGLQAGTIPGRLLFFGWFEHPEYRRTPPPGFTPTPDELAMQARHKLDLEQLAWYRWKLGRQGSRRKMQREYPNTIDEAFGSAGDGWFEVEDLASTKRLPWVVGEDRVRWADPDPLDRYAIGGDCSAGRGGDPAAHAVLSLKRRAPVSAWTSAVVGPSQHARLLADEGYRYATRVPGQKPVPAAICLESNGEWGAKTLGALRALGYPEACLYTGDDGKEWTTNARSKVLMFEALRDAWRDGLLEAVDERTLGQVWSVLLDDKGVRPFVPEGLPHHGDLVIGYALAWQQLQRLRLPPQQTLPQWVKDQQHAALMATHPLHRNGRY